MERVASRLLAIMLLIEDSLEETRPFDECRRAEKNASYYFLAFQIPPFLRLGTFISFITVHSPTERHSTFPTARLRRSKFSQLRFPFRRSTHLLLPHPAFLIRLRMASPVPLFFCAMLLLHVRFVEPRSNEGNALMSLKSAFGNIRNALADWDHHNVHQYCSWTGVSCDNATRSVISLNLSNLNLGGEISPALGDLISLQSLDLQGNNLSGQIPDEIENCLPLVHLDLSANLLHGDIPFSISNLKRLEHLNLKDNHMTGPIPSTLTQIPNLKTLELAHNRFTGDIPRLIYWNEILQYLGLRGNLLTGNLSPDICQLTGLWYFDVRGNYLTGSIPATIGNCTSFQVLDLAYNQFSGELPYNIGFLQVATLSLQGNELTGRIPEVIGLMQALAVLDLSENRLSGPVPSILGNLSYTGKLYLNGNNLDGVIPAELGNMTRLSYLQLNDNDLAGVIPPQLGKLQLLFELNLANNNLQGNIPSQIGSCTSLNQLNLHGNNLSGPIPSTLQSLGSLTYLNLSSNNFDGRITIDMGKIINLDTVDLSCNRISGPLPSSIANLEHLLLLNVSRNKIGGSFPSEFGRLRNIQTIDVSFNELTGTIPRELGQLLTVESLIMNNNHLEGGIPDELSNCFSLALLNVSDNNVTGGIPPPAGWPSSSSSSPDRTLSGIFFRLTSVACSVLGFAATALVAASVARRRNLRRREGGAPFKLVVLHMDMAVRTYDDVLRMTEDFSEKYIIGHGSSSTVYKCALKGSRPVAVKRLCRDRYAAFENELQTIGGIRHRNLVGLHGYARSPSGYLLFYDYMDNGSLFDVLHSPEKKVKLDWETRRRIAVGAAQGLCYLHHDCSPRIIHRDVKSSNILLDGNFDGRLSDFGIAKRIPNSLIQASTFVLGTIGYIDPNYARTSCVSEKSDVYGFGIVLLELLTGRKAVDAGEFSLYQFAVSRASDDAALIDALDPDVTVTCVDLSQVRKTFHLALLCTKPRPTERPTMLEVSRVLVSLVPSPAKHSHAPAKLIDCAPFAIGADGGGKGENMYYRPPQGHLRSDSYDGQWVIKFHDVKASL